MALWQKLLLGLLISGLLWLTITTWGSIGSAAMIFGLITMAAALLHQYFVNRDGPDIYE